MICDKLNTESVHEHPLRTDNESDLTGVTYVYMKLNQPYFYILGSL